ncbi:MAG: universal stress protein [Hadesarchaea archaeon]|nr:universal stress protein [Hadesarchaea archaeon]
MLEKILVPIDSMKWDNTRNAVQVAMDFSQGCSIEGDIELIFLHVLQVKPRVPMSEKERLTEKKKEKIKEDFKEIKEMCEERGLKKVRTIIEEGKPANTIVEKAQDEKIDMIVMGSGKLHDRSAGGRIHKFFYGSVTEEVIHEAPCSVLVARP